MTARHRHGVAVGKFYPPHAGHQALVEAALAACDRLTVEVIGSAAESIPVDLRAAWLRELHPAARVVAAVDEAEIDFGSETAWRHHTGVIAGLLDPVDGPVDVVFTSDAYGEELARRLGARWRQVDPGRRVVAARHRRPRGRARALVGLARPGPPAPRQAGGGGRRRVDGDDDPLP